MRSEPSFIQLPPELGNQFESDWLLHAWLEAELPEALWRAERPLLKKSAHALAASGMRCSRPIG